MAYNLTLKGKVALVTGSTRGIGWASATLFAEAGATVIINGVSDVRALDQRVHELQEKGFSETSGLLFDVGNPAAVKEAYSTILSKHGRLDILVNNAGIMDDSLIGMITPERFEKTYSANVRGVLLNMQYASRLMARNKSGSIINFSSIVARYGNEAQVLYAGSKAAVIGMTLSAAKEFAPQNIRVNVIAPGLIETDLNKSLTPEKREGYRQTIAMKRFGTPKDVANAVLFLASDLSSYITGQIIGVDGGMVI
jgi:3-oxoacyl-[acyl-carrier protein] reductase